MHIPAISVVLPVFNTERYLPLLLSSLLNQSESDLEIVAIDDGSTDNSLTLLKDAASKDPRLKVLHQDNKGLSAARNEALKHACGRWIAFADSDDWLAPETLKIWRQRAEAEHLDLVIGNGFKFSLDPADRGGLLCKKQPWNQVISGPEWIIWGESIREWPNWVWLQLIRHDLIKEIGLRFVEGMLHEDSPWTLQLSLAARRVGFVQEPLYGYRVSSESLVQTASLAVIYERARSHIRIVQQLAAYAAQSPPESVLTRALLRQANIRGNHFFRFFRRQLHDPMLRAELVREFVATGSLKTMFMGGGGMKNFSRAMLSWLSVHWYLRMKTVRVVGRTSPRAEQ